METRDRTPQSSSWQTTGSQVPHKNVSISATSRLLSERQYKVRRPLFTTQQHTSILKKTHAAGTEQSETNLEDHGLTGMRHIPQPRFPPHTELSPSGSKSWMSPLHSQRPSELRPHNSVLQVQQLSPPVRPRLSSPVLHPRYTPLSSHKRTHTPEQTTNTSYQAEYWACAIPKDPPPSLSGGNPQQDYEALLDYTYPLRSAPKVLDWTFQDSGIEVDHLSSGLSELNLSFGDLEQLKDPQRLGPVSPDGMDSPFPATSSFSADHVLSPEWSKLKNTVVPSISAALITLPWDKGAQEDEEFRPLPEKIELLQQLSRQVHEATTLLLSTQSHCSPVWSRNSGQQTKLMDSLGGPDQQNSLMEHISVFCSHLEQLVRWLYVASHKIERLAPPTVDIHSVKSSLAQYQNFQRDVNSHLPLTSSVLQTGRLLLSSIHNTSPVLRDTLLLIESQSRLLERHTEHFFSSILSAMDNLTQPH
ncbi:hypothetical protein WMY93_018322 [Mugilogobius chulae]|uniref:Centrosomal protein of 68 kDa n=1 Tax=Mugilogobius chulae TaxID=88201 RepID=A0AAW0NLA0_9GOBI